MAHHFDLSYSKPISWWCITGGLSDVPRGRTSRGAEVEVDGFVAPRYEALRPFKPEKTDEFPVYPNLVETLVATKEHPDKTIRHAMAVCSTYAYGDVSTVATIMARMGLEQNHCLMIHEYVDAMFITSTSFLVQSSDGRAAILCYRGTPVTSLITWLTNLNIEPTHIDVKSPTGSRECYVHGGFYRNVRSTRYEILNALKRAIAGRSVALKDDDQDGKLNKLEALYITGHSLGGASAALLALLLVTEPAYERDILKRLKAVYTFGAPMLASRELASDCNEHQFLHERVIRYVYDSDVVPQVPPRESGRFAHFGRGYQYKPKGKGDKWVPNDEPKKQLRNLLEIPTSVLSLVTPDITLTRRLHFHSSIRDHLPQYYIQALTPDDVRSEFGD